MQHSPKCNKKCYGDYKERLKLKRYWSIPILLFRSNIFAYQNDFPSALKDLDQCIQLSPQDYREFSFRGLLHHKMNNFSKSKKDFLRVLELTKDSQEAESLRAQGIIFQIYPDLKTQKE